MKNLKNRIEVLEEELQKKEQRRQQVQKLKKVVEEAKQIQVEKLPYSYSSLKQFIDPETMSVLIINIIKDMLINLTQHFQKKITVI